jgi:uncharacterized membrane protein
MKDVFHKDKTEFQVERLILFSDAVFAIAITLLIIEIRIPDISQGNVTNQSFWQAFLPSVPKFLGFLMSFSMIGLFWSKHHQMFGFVTNYTPKLIFLNLFYLCTIVLMPYTTAVYSEYSLGRYATLIIPFLFYSINIILAGVASLLLWQYVGNPKHKVTHIPIDKNYLLLAKLRALILPFAFLLSFVVCWIIGSIKGAMLLCLIPFYFNIVKWYAKRLNNSAK